MVWLMLSKVKKSNLWNANAIVFFQKIEIGRQNGCKFFQNDHVKAIKNEKNEVLFLWYGLGYQKWKKGIGKSNILNVMPKKKSRMWLFFFGKKATFGNVAFFL